MSERRTRSHRMSAAQAAGLLDLGAWVETEFEEQAGDVVGRYRLVEMLGEGAFGAVWRAEQWEPIQREVALKRIKRGMDGREVMARFSVESQALARMDHPNIAAVFDAAADDEGLPYFAMEWVKGEPLTEYCDARNLTIRQRLEIFIPVCLAVQHAHQKAILHRDLKPSNLLVTEVDGRPVPKVIDFGIAKALGGEAAGDGLQTRVGAILGTLAYMSPEQAGSTRDVDTRSDVYSLGVILFELMCGRTPDVFDSDIPYDGALLQIRNGVIPKPSQCLLDDEVAGARGEDLVGIQRRLRGDLDRIVLKALAKDRRDRYATASSLAGDLGRYLRGDPVSAVPPSWGYQVSKFALRHRAGVMATVLVTVALLAGTGVSLWQASEARRSRVQSEANLVKAREAVELFLNRMTLEPRLQEADFSDFRRALLESALPFYEELAAQSRADLPFTAGNAGAFNQLGLIYYELGQVTEALGAYEQAEALAASLVKEEPEDLDALSLWASIENNRAAVWERAHDDLGARNGQRRALGIVRRILAKDPERVADRKIFITLLVNHGILLAHDPSELGGAQKLLEEALGEAEKLERERPEEEEGYVAYAQSNLAKVLHSRGDPAAVEGYQRAISLQRHRCESHPNEVFQRHLLATSLLNLGYIFTYGGRPTEALPLLEEAIKIREELALQFPSNPEHLSSVATGRCLVGMDLRQLGRVEEAVAELEKAVALQHALVEAFPEDARYRSREGSVWDQLAAFQRERGEVDAAVVSYRRSVECHREQSALRPDDEEPKVLLAQRWNALGKMAQEEGRVEEVIEAAEGLASLRPERWQELISGVEFLAWVAGQQGEGSVEVAERAVALLGQAIAGGFPGVPELKSSEAWVALRAVPGFDQLRERPPGPPDGAPTAFQFEYSYEDPGARDWVRQGDRWLETQPSGKVNEFAVVERCCLRAISGTHLRGITEPRLEVFIPDKGEKPQLQVRMDGGDWALFANLEKVE
ncbi:tetratricopeptide (TPR) repeat protein [Haloferula luteola]|uniref:Tetratricopeptide (TPR) repeat protein n=1 Tax=Haloferula luteola TaxID=595692 RepID=A0A840V7V0_9BACT|nr:serine/threonine-protein kinase [Haloferula luteola]MBB5351664.1 tetratricopeptide (TPR) repeat protein [Haloferula luteola]